MLIYKVPTSCFTFSDAVTPVNTSIICVFSVKNLKNAPFFHLIIYSQFPCSLLGNPSIYLLLSDLKKWVYRCRFITGGYKQSVIFNTLATTKLQSFWAVHVAIVSLVLLLWLSWCDLSWDASVHCSQECTQIFHITVSRCLPTAYSEDNNFGGSQPVCCCTQMFLQRLDYVVNEVFCIALSAQALLAVL